jgi:hypothetical protein
MSVKGSGKSRAAGMGVGKKTPASCLLESPGVMCSSRPGLGRLGCIVLARAPGARGRPRPGAVARKAPRSFVLWLRPVATPGAARAHRSCAGLCSVCPRAPTSLSAAASGLQDRSLRSDLVTRAGARAVQPGTGSKKK